MAVGAAGCSESNPAAPRVPTGIAPSGAGQGQIGVVSQALAAPIAVVVTDQSGVPIANAAVTWLPNAGSGSVSSATTMTDANGVAQVTWTLGTVAGVDSVQAQIAAGASTIITATATAASATSLAIVSGDNQEVTSGLATAPMIVKAVDQFGNAVSNAAITWSSPSGGTLSAQMTMTDANGQATVTLATDLMAETYAITASLGTMSVLFTVTSN
jgi:hypothetical protein